VSLPGAYVAQAWRDPLLRNPLDGYQHASDKIRRMCEAVANRIEVYNGSASWGGKTWGGAALGTALACGRDALDDVRLPQVSLPHTHWVLVQDHEQQVDSSQKAYRHWIGERPHTESMIDRGKDQVGLIRVKPDNWHSDDPETWSKIVFRSQKNPEGSQGVRVGSVHSDEAPDPTVWREMRKNAAHRWITYTPLKRREWWWIEEDFKGCEDVPSHGRLLLRSSVYENRFLSPARIHELEESYRGDPEAKARLYGIPMDADMLCPFDAEGLMRWRARCRPGEKRLIVVQREVVGYGGRQRKAVTVEVEVWAPYDPREEYVIPVDLSSGVRGGGRHRAGLHVWGRRRRALAVRFVDFLDPYGMGSLASILGAEYGRAKLDPENNGGWIGQFLAACGDAGYDNFSRQFVKEKGKLVAKLGFNNNVETRGDMASAWRRALNADDVGMWSQDVVDCLGSLRVGEDDRIEAGPDAGPGNHAEDFIIGGRALDTCYNRTLAPEPEVEESVGLQNFREALNASFGGREIELPDYGTNGDDHDGGVRW